MLMMWRAYSLFHPSHLPFLAYIYVLDPPLFSLLLSICWTMRWGSASWTLELSPHTRPVPSFVYVFYPIDPRTEFLALSLVYPSTRTMYTTRVTRFLCDSLFFDVHVDCCNFDFRFLLFLFRCFVGAERVMKAIREHDIL